MCVCVCLCGSGEVSQYQVCKEPLVRALKLCVCVCATVGSFPSYQVCKELLVRALKACVCVCVCARAQQWGGFPVSGVQGTIGQSPQGHRLEAVKTWMADSLAASPELWGPPLD